MQRKRLDLHNTIEVSNNRSLASTKAVHAFVGMLLRCATQARVGMHNPCKRHHMHCKSACHLSPPPGHASLPHTQRGLPRTQTRDCGFKLRCIRGRRGLILIEIKCDNSVKNDVQCTPPSHIDVVEPSWLTAVFE